MKPILSRHRIVTAGVAAGLLFASASFSFAFKGMGSSMPSGSGMGSPHGGTMEMAEPDIMGHQGSSQVVVATVNDKEISMGKLMRTIMELITRGGYGGGKMSAEMSRKLRYDALQELALEELAFQRGGTLGIQPDSAEVASYLEAKISAAGGREAFDAILAKQHKSVDDIKGEISRYLVIRDTIQREVNEKVTVSDDEVDTIYAENKQQFISPERVTITDVTFFLDPDDPGSVKRVEEVAGKIGAEYGNDPTKILTDGFAVESGLNVSPQHRAGHYEIAKKMEPGSLSSPRVIDGTLHLIKLDSYQAARETPEAQAKDSIASQLKASKRQQMLSEWRKKLLQEAKISIVHEMLQEEKK